MKRWHLLVAIVFLLISSFAIGYMHGWEAAWEEVECGKYVLSGE